VPPVRVARRGRTGCGHLLARRRPRQPLRAEPPQPRRRGHRHLRTRRDTDGRQAAPRCLAGPEFASAARTLRSTTFVAHVRYASTGARTTANTHPFAEDRRILAHNGVVTDLPAIDARLRTLGARHLVHGDTDSERLFAMVTAETARCGGDVTAGLTAAVTWVSDHVPVYALNLVLATATDLWALRYPGTHELYVLDRPPGGTGTDRPMDARTSRIRARSEHLGSRPSVVVASEPMDDDPAWRLLDPGELLHVDAGLRLESTRPFRPTPRHLLRRSDLDPDAEASQHAGDLGPVRC